MTYIDENRLKGNFAETFASAWLSRISLVRPVAGGTDIGIDLYCESVVEGHPFLHFWVQVKAVGSDRAKQRNDIESAWCEFDVKHLQYWAQQPIPVYAFLVPVDEWPPSQPKKIYCIRLTDHLIRHGVPATGESRMWSSGVVNSDSIDDDLREFVERIIPWDFAALLTTKGAAAPLPGPFGTIRNGSPEFPAGIYTRYLAKILDTIRDTSTLALFDAIAANGEDLDMQRNRRRLTQILSLFSDDLHPLGVSALYHAAIKDGDKAKARETVLRAICRLQENAELSSDSTEVLIRGFEALLSDL